MLSGRGSVNSDERQTVDQVARRCGSQAERDGALFGQKPEALAGLLIEEKMRDALVVRQRRRGRVG